MRPPELRARPLYAVALLAQRTAVVEELIVLAARRRAFASTATPRRRSQRLSPCRSADSRRS